MYKNLTIGQRLGLGFGLLLALLTVLAGLSTWQMGRLAQNATYYATNLVPSYESQHHIALALSDERRYELRHVMSSADAEKADAEARIMAYHRVISERLDHYGKHLVSDDVDRQSLAAVRSAIDAYHAVWESIRAVSRQAVSDPSKTAEAQQLMLGDSARAYATVQAAVTRWWDYNVQMARDQEAASRATHASANWALGGMVVAALLMGATAAVLITRSIVRPIQRAVVIATTVADGDLASRIEARGRDETAQLLQALQRMQAGLAAVVANVRHNSESVATASTQIAQGNHDLSQRTEEQASTLQQTAATMEQLGTTVRHNADNAQQANQLAQRASEVAAQGGDVVGQVVATMQHISHSSRKIGDIIGVIDGIAFQTNILALNAAVEAARAGEQGRGFAVVASEVRTLAQRSAEAAREIKTLIGRSVEQVEQGTLLVDQAGKTMGEIVSSVERVSGIVAEITSASEEQATGVRQVGDAVGQMDQVTQQNAALVEESAAAAESLRNQALQLVQAVAVFKLAQAGAAAACASASMRDTAPSLA